MTNLAAHDEHLTPGTPARVAVLRIHGIGEHTATEIIGPAATVEGSPQLYQSDRDPALFALSWSRLTRTASAISSFVLLPFSLLNAAGFMTLSTGRTEAFNGSGVLKMANVTVSASWIVWGILLFWDLPRLSQTPAVIYGWRAIGIALAGVIAWRVFADLSKRRRERHQQSAIAQAMGTSPRHWFGHYLAVGFFVWLALGFTRDGMSGLYALLWIQIVLVGFAAMFTRLFYASPLNAHGLMSTDAAFIACVVSHLWGYAIVQACAMVFLGKWRQVDFYIPPGLVAGVKDDQIDTVFLRCTVVLAAWVVVGIAGLVLRWLVARVLALVRSTGDGARPRIRNWRLRIFKRRAGRPPQRPRVSWLLMVWITAWAVAPLRAYARGIGDVPPWLWRLPWRQISVVAGVASVGALILVVARRSLVATAFDVLGFLPRQFHPWSPSFYADAAIKDTHAAIRRLAERYDLVWIVGHSQGSVIAYAALASLDAETAAKCRLITCGSPLMRLYGWFFPVWFTPARLAELSTRLSPDGNGVSWWNFYRCTDPIAAPLRLPTPAVRDVPLHEPDASCAAGGRPLIHSQYWEDPVLAAVIANQPPPQLPPPCCCGAGRDLVDGRPA